MSKWVLVQNVDQEQAQSLLISRDKITYIGILDDGRCEIHFVGGDAVTVFGDPEDIAVAGAIEDATPGDDRDIEVEEED